MVDAMTVLTFGIFLVSCISLVIKLIEMSKPKN